jgi:hypothetical protein
VPRLAHCRTRPFFCPILASSWNQTSTGVPLGRSARCALSVRGKFFVSLDGLAVLRRMARPGAHGGEAELLEERRHVALVVGDAEARLDDLLEINAPPAHHAVNGRIRPRFHDLGQFRLLRWRQPRRRSAPPGVLQSLEPRRIKPVHPIPQRLPVHAADLRGLLTAPPLPDRRQRQKQRLWLASFEALASRRSAAAEKSVRIFTADPMARILPAPKNHRSTRAGIPRVSRQSRWTPAPPLQVVMYDDTLRTERHCNSPPHFLDANPLAGFNLHYWPICRTSWQNESVRKTTRL